VLGDVVPPAIADAILDDQDSAEEHERLLHVACTRAVEMLILPTLSVPRANSWAHLLDLGQDDILEWDAARFSRRPLARVVGENHQSAEAFAAEQAAIADASRPIWWVRPSHGDADRVVELARVDESADADPAGLVTVMGSAIRGAVLHKLVEEILTGEIEEKPQCRCSSYGFIGLKKTVEHEPPGGARAALTAQPQSLPAAINA
jgi:CRISPR-associated exonuclease Cas4